MRVPVGYREADEMSSQQTDGHYNEVNDCNTWKPLAIC